jgi:uncharacterized protein YjiS (DUF1127 family)
MTKILNRWHAYRQVVRQLDILNDRDLADVGIKRGDIQNIARDYAAQL